MTPTSCQVISTKVVTESLYKAGKASSQQGKRESYSDQEGCVRLGLPRSRRQNEIRCSRDLLGGKSRGNNISLGCMCDSCGGREGRKEHWGRKDLALQHNSNKGLTRSLGSPQVKVAKRRSLPSCLTAPALVLLCTQALAGCSPRKHGLGARVEDPGGQQLGLSGSPTPTADLSSLFPKAWEFGELEAV